MINITINSLRRLIYKYVQDYEIKDLMEEYLEEIENTVTSSLQIEVELENILDICAANARIDNRDYSEVLGSVNRIRKEVYGE